MDGLLDLVGPAYARDGQYWKTLVYSAAFQGLLLGAVVLGFQSYHKAISDATWFNAAYQEALDYAGPGTINVTYVASGGDETQAAYQDVDESVVDRLKLGGGQWWYVGMLTGAGLAVGLFKVIWTALLSNHPFPDKIPGFLKELTDMRADDVLLFIAILITSGISIGLGASVGPEAAVGSAGACVGTIVGHRWQIGPFKAQSLNREVRETEMQEQGEVSLVARFFAFMLPDFSQRPELCVLNGMAGSFAALFPSQFISPLLIMELGHHWGQGGKFAFTETVAGTGITATFSYGLYVLAKGDTILGSFVLPVAAYQDVSQLELGYLADGALLGLISGLVGFVGFLCLVMGAILGMLVTKQWNALGKRLNLPDGVLGKLMTPVIGGFIVGLLNVAAPLALGDGSDQLSAVMTLGPLLGKSTLLVTAFVKMLCVGISLGFGFIGGPFFPLIFAGACVGSAAHLFLPQIPIVLTYSACMVAVPCAILPGFFFLTSLSSIVFVIGGPATSVVFIACIVSYSTVCGMGFLQNLINRLAKLQKTPGDESDDGEDAGVKTANPLLHSAYNAAKSMEESTEQESLPLRAGDVSAQAEVGQADVPDDTVQDEART